jgi:hypothetical protein
MPDVDWSNATDLVIGGDLTAALAYVTPAGGAVVTAVAPLGLRDRDAGTVTFTTSLGFGRKLERIKHDPSVALAYHAREHGHASGTHYVLVQGRAEVMTEPDRAFLDALQPRVERFLGPPKKGPFWDRWLAAYYSDRVPVRVNVERVAEWPDLRCAGPSQTWGAPWPDPPAPQAEPKKGTGARVDTVRAARRLNELDHLLLAFRGADGLPVIYPIEIPSADGGGLTLAASAGLLPEGGRRAGVLSHSYEPKLIGLASRQHTGWLQVDAASAIYAPHTEGGFRAPSNKTLLLLANGYMARRGLKRARRAQMAA